MIPIIVVLISLLGLTVGSFYNAILWRYGKKKSIKDAHSVCVHCRHPLGLFDLIPLLSFCLLGGRCRYCRKPIPLRYPIVELATTLILLMPLIPFHFSLVYIAIVVFALLLELLFLFDLRYSVLPDEISIPAFGVGIAVTILIGRGFSEALLGAILGGGFFALQYIVSRGKWIGAGDIRLGAIMGVALGWKLVCVALFFSYVTGALVGVFLIGSQKKQWKSHLPFGTFLTAATYVVLLGSDIWMQIVSRYFAL